VAVVARTYAKALFDAAKEQSRLDEVREELQEFVTALHEVPELGAFLRNPQLDPTAKAEALSAVMKGADELIRNFFRVVAEKGRAPLLEEIVDEYEELIAAEEQILKVELTTAFELDDKEATSIVEQIEQASGRKVEAMRSVDPDLVGGLVLRAGSLEVDSSVRGRLDRLRHELVQGARQ
jgi:F-type H+-transporting ATPase subunit delta